MTLSVFNRQRKIPIDRAALEEFGRRAVSLCAREKGRGLTNLPRVDIILISDRRMSALHRRFLDIAGPTDVITFQHGEIFISTDTARRQARELGTTLRHELHLYMVHGLLHLRGFDDRTPADRRRMHAAQERILAAAAGPRLYKERPRAGKKRTRAEPELPRATAKLPRASAKRNRATPKLPRAAGPRTRARPKPPRAK